MPVRLEKQVYVKITTPLPVHVGLGRRVVTVSMSAVLACHLCYCAGSSFAWGLNLRAVVFSEARRQRFSLGTAVSSPPSSVQWFSQQNKAQINAISTLSNLIAELSLRTKWHVTWHLHVISARCVARDVLTIAPGPLELWRQFAALWGDCKTSRIAPLNAIIILLLLTWILLRLSSTISSPCPMTTDYTCCIKRLLRLRLGFVHPLQDVVLILHQCLPLSSVRCFPNPYGSLLLCSVVLPSSAWSPSWSLPSPWLPLCAAFSPPIVLHPCYMTGPFPLLFQCVFYDINYLCSFPYFW